MYPAAIDAYTAPNTFEEAFGALDAHGEDAVCIAGGQSLMQAIKSRLVQPKCIVDLQHIAELKGISSDADGIHIGAMTRYREIAADAHLHGAYQALNDAASHVGDRQVRNRGTIGGSLCWNYIAACMPPTAIALGAQCALAKSSGRRTLAAEDFIQSPLETAREANEILVSVDLPAAPARTGSAYKKWGLAGGCATSYRHLRTSPARRHRRLRERAFRGWWSEQRAETLECSRNGAGRGYSKRSARHRRGGAGSRRRNRYTRRYVGR